MKDRALITIGPLLVGGVSMLLIAVFAFKISRPTLVEDQGVIAGSQTDRGAPVILPSPVPLVRLKPEAKPPQVKARSWALIDGETGHFLIGEATDNRVPIASITKIMTSIILIERMNLDELVSVPNEAADTPGSTIGLKTGEHLTVKQLLYGLLIQSGNDAALTVASHFPGGDEAFVATMNAKGSNLGLKNTQFKDAAGLDDSGYSTPKEIGLLLAYAIKHPIFIEISATPEYQIVSQEEIVHQLKNSNRLVRRDEPYYFADTVAGKTGFTPTAGHSLAAVAKRGGHHLIGVIMNTHENTVTASAAEARSLLEWGFDNVEWL